MYDDNVYYHPEKYGLTIVGEVSWKEPCYDFDFTLVLVDEEGILWWGRDSGCSCPAPFEDHKFPDDFLPGTFNEMIANLYVVLEVEAEYRSEREYEYANSQIAKIAEQVMWRRRIK